MIGNIFTSIIEISIASSFIIVILLIISPYINKVYITKWRYLLWLILTIRLIIPFNITLPTTPVNFKIPSDSILANQPNNIQTNVKSTKLNELQSPIITEENRSYALFDIISYIWILGVSVFILHTFLMYGLFHQKMKQKSVIITDDNIILKVNRICRELGIKKNPRICQCKSACSPMMYGFIKPTLILSDGDFKDYDLEVILMHELVHYKRHDLWFKFLLFIANAIHWFNPFVYFMVKSAHSDIEFYCDEEVIKNFDLNSRKLYSQAILSSMKKERSNDVVLSTQFKGDKKMMKNRFSNILNTTKKRKGTAALCILTVLILASGLFVACKQTQTTDKNLEDNNAKEITQKVDKPKKDDTKNNITEEVGTILYEFDKLGLSIEFPENWKDLVGINENYVEYSADGGAGIEVYHKATKEVQAEKGTLFYIERWLGTFTENDPPVKEGNSSVVLKTDKYTYILRTPSDTQWNEKDDDMAVSYKKLSEQLDVIKSSVKGVNNPVSIPNAGYQTEAEFLSSPDGKLFRTTAYGAARAVLSGDVNELEKYLINPSDAKKFVEYFSSYQSKDLIKFQSKFILDAIKSDDIIEETSYEFLPLGDDSNSYITMALKKVNGEWKIDWLANEK